MQTETSTQNSSVERPIPLQVRTDLVCRRVGYQGVGSWVVKDPAGLKYHRLHEEQYHVLQLLDGRRSLDEIHTLLRQKFPACGLTLTSLQQLVTDLHRRGLVLSDRPGQGELLLTQQRKARRKRFWSGVKNVLFLRLPGWDPERTLQRLYPLVRWYFRPGAISLAVLLVLASWMLLAVQFSHFQSQLPAFQQFFGWPNVIYLWLTLALCKVLHEFGHGLCCTHFGGECHEMGLMLLVFSPTLYCDVTDSWLLPNKWQRIWIGAAGMWVELILSALAVFTWWWTTPGLLHHLALNVFFVTSITTVVFNANPLMRFDGYYIIADLLEIPNLRQKADRLLRDTFSWYCLGIEQPPDPFAPQRDRGWFILFAAVSAVYRWIVLAGICLFLYVWLKPWDLQSIGIALAVFSLAGVIISMIMTVWQIITAPRNEPMNYHRLAISLTVLAGLVIAALVIPLPLHVEAAFLVQPEGVQHLHTALPGRLVEVRVRAGERVEAGQELAVLENTELDDEFLDLWKKITVQQRTITRYRNQNDLPSMHLAVQLLDSLLEQLVDVEQRRRQLVLKAPCAGTVVAPPRRPEPKQDHTEQRLSNWFGTPLDPENTGCFLEEQTHLLSLAPNERLEAVLLVDQADRDDLTPGRQVELKLEHLPDRTYAGTIQEVSLRPLEFAPEALSSKAGGELPTVTDQAGRERLTSAAWQATVQLNQDTDLLLPGLRGTGRFLISRRTAGDWLWRAIRQTFHFRL